MSATDLANGLASAPYLRQGGLDGRGEGAHERSRLNERVGVGAALYEKRREVEDDGPKLGALSGAILCGERREVKDAHHVGLGLLEHPP